MGVGGARIVQEAQRDPAGHELVLGAIIGAVRRRGIADDGIGVLGIAVVEQLAGQHAALHPPFVEIVAPVELGDGLDQRHRLGEFVGAPQHLDAGELVADVVAGRGRHSVERGLAAALGQHCDARLGDQRLVAAKPRRGAEARFGVVLFVEPPVHARLVVGVGQHARRRSRRPGFRHPARSRRCATPRAPAPRRPCGCRWRACARASAKRPLADSGGYCEK